MSLILSYSTVRVRGVIAQAKFWAAITGGHVMAAHGGGSVVLPVGDVEIHLLEDASARPEDTGLVFSHGSDSLPAEISRLTGLGARVVKKVNRGWGVGEVVLADPEGNSFIVSSSDAEVRAFEESDEAAPLDPFWADAEQPELTSGTGTTVAAEG